MTELTIIAIALGINAILMVSGFRWITKPQRDRRRREKLLRQSE